MNSPSPNESTSSSSSSSPAECRICKEFGTVERPLISPCECTGSMRTVHGDCLQRWMNTRPRYGDETEEIIENIMDYNVCEVCHSPYRYVIDYRRPMNNRSLYFSLPALHQTAQCGWLSLLAIAVLYGLYTVIREDKEDPDSTTDSGDYILLSFFLVPAILGTYYAATAIYARWQRSVSVEVLVDVPVNRNPNGTVRNGENNNGTAIPSGSSSSSVLPTDTSSPIRFEAVPNDTNEDINTVPGDDNAKNEEESTLLIVK